MSGSVVVVSRGLAEILCHLLPPTPASPPVYNFSLVRIDLRDGDCNTGGGARLVSLGLFVFVYVCVCVCDRKPQAGGAVLQEAVTTSSFLIHPQPRQVFPACRHKYLRTRLLSFLPKDRILVCLTGQPNRGLVVPPVQTNHLPWDHGPNLALTLLKPSLHNKIVQDGSAA